MAAALDCDVLVCCVDRPWPRFLLNTLAYSHLIPVVDGGILATVKPDGTPQHVTWRIHTVGPEYACMVCLNALRLSDVALDREGRPDDPDYIAGLNEADKPASARVNRSQLKGDRPAYARAAGSGEGRWARVSRLKRVTKNAAVDASPSARPIQMPTAPHPTANPSVQPMPNPIIQ